MRVPSVVVLGRERQRRGEASGNGTGRLNRSDLIEQVALRHEGLPAADVDAAVRSIVEQMSDALGRGGRVEIRGFGSFSLRYLPARRGRNPKTGEPVDLAGRHVPRFKPGRRLRGRVDRARCSPDPQAP